MKKMVLVVFIICALLVGVINLVVFTTKTADSLVLVAVVFRHGDTTPTIEHTYPTDPYRDYPYYPYGRGQMTTVMTYSKSAPHSLRVWGAAAVAAIFNCLIFKESMRKIYKIGRALRERYGNYLGDTFSPQSLAAVSASAVSTQLSMQAVLAGLYMPGEEFALAGDLMWRPIYYESVPSEHDDYLGFWGKCKAFQSVAKKSKMFFNTSYVDQLDMEYKGTYNYLSQHSGEKVTKLLDAIWFYHILNAQKRFGLILPQWSDKVFPNELKSIYRKYWEVLSSTAEGRKFTSGKLLKTILEEFTKKANDTLSIDKKLYLFSAYDYAINGILGSMQIEHNYDFHSGRFLVLELHKIADTYGIRIFYHDGKNDDLKEKLRDDCEMFCPLHKMVTLCEPNFSDGDCT